MGYYWDSTGSGLFFVFTSQFSGVSSFDRFDPLWMGLQWNVSWILQQWNMKGNIGFNHSGWLAGKPIVNGALNWTIIYTWWIFHCHSWLPEGGGMNLIKGNDMIHVEDTIWTVNSGVFISSVSTGCLLSWGSHSYSELLSPIMGECW